MGTHSLLRAFTHSDGVGKLIFVALAVLSVIGWATFMGRMWSLRFGERQFRQLRARFKSQSDRPLSLEVPQDSAVENFALEIYCSLRKLAVALLNKNRSVEGSAPSATRAYLSQVDVDLLASQLACSLHTQSEQLNRHLYLLSTCVTLAPFLGLLGTVWGILLSFGALQGGAGGPSSEAVLQGLSLALATTVVGLIVAIPALIGYTILRVATGKIEAELGEFAQALLISIDVQYRNLD